MNEMPSGFGQTESNAGNELLPPRVGAAQEGTANRYTESGYKTEAWRYRHGVAYGLMFILAFFLLTGRSLWGGIAGVINGFASCWQNEVKPLFRQ